MHSRPAPITSGWFCAFLVLACVTFARAAEQFAVSLQAERSVKGTHRIAIELINTSTSVLEVRALTNVFQGSIFLRNTKGETHEFIQTNYLRMLQTGLWAPPVLDLAPGAALRIEHSATEFARVSDMNDLESELVSGGEIWCQLHYHPIQKVGPANRRDP